MILGALALTACTGTPAEPEPAPEPAPTVTVTAPPEPAVTVTAEPPEPGLIVPDPAVLTCENIVTSERLSWLTQSGLVPVVREGEITPGSLECLWGYPDSRTSALDYYAYAPIDEGFRDAVMAEPVTANTTTHLHDPHTDIAYREDQGGGMSSRVMTADEMFIVYGYDKLAYVAPLVDAGGAA